jgi:hypothetical protein
MEHPNEINPSCFVFEHIVFDKVICRISNTDKTVLRQLALDYIAKNTPQDLKSKNFSYKFYEY